MSTQKQVQAMHNQYRDLMILQRYQASGANRAIAAIAGEFGVSQLHVVDLIREAQLAEVEHIHITALPAVDAAERIDEWLTEGGAA